VTYGGDQNATDGGVDVRVTFQQHGHSGFVPREATGFQQKRRTCACGHLGKLPGGIIRSPFRKLADQFRCLHYRNSQGSISDTALQRRGDAMTEAIQSLGTASALAIDFL